ncbi:hypothetical protein Aperf_G00000131864 [Anoplocephala perfoliata]
MEKHRNLGTGATVHHDDSVGISVSFLAGVNISAELQERSPFLMVFWIGFANLVVAFGVFLCVVNPRKGVFIAPAFLDAACITVTIGGLINLLKLTVGTAYIVTWIGLVEAILLLYHCLSCIYDTGIHLKWKILGATVGNDGRGVERVSGTTGNQEAIGRRRQTRAPPTDFRLPDEMPRLPGYEEACKSGYLPPIMTH